MYTPAQHDEITGLTNYVDQHLAALRAALYGLTEDEARSTPCRSSLSLAALVKHATHGMRGYIAQLGGASSVLDEAAYAAYLAGLVVDEDESVFDLLDEFDVARASLLDAMRSVDPDADIVTPPAPWHGRMEPTPAKARFDLVHFLEEFARHAGHADILREQIDGMPVPAPPIEHGGSDGVAVLPAVRAGTGNHRRELRSCRGAENHWRSTDTCGSVAV